MNDASWAISAFLTIGFFIAAIATTGAMAVGWFVLAIGMTVVTVVRIKAARKPPAD